MDADRREFMRAAAMAAASAAVTVRSPIASGLPVVAAEPTDNGIHWNKCLVAFAGSVATFRLALIAEGWLPLRVTNTPK